MMWLLPAVPATIMLAALGLGRIGGGLVGERLPTVTRRDVHRRPPRTGR